MQINTTFHFGSRSRIILGRGEGELKKTPLPPQTIKVPQSLHVDIGSLLYALVNVSYPDWLIRSSFRLRRSDNWQKDSHQNSWIYPRVKRKQNGVTNHTIQPPRITRPCTLTQTKTIPTATKVSKKTSSNNFALSKLFCDNSILFTVQTNRPCMP